jgi:hypothetical protein
MPLKKPAISCAKRSATAACSASRSIISGCRPHGPTTPVQYHTLHNGRSVGTTAIWNHALHNEPRSGTTPSTRSRCPEPAISTTRFRTTPCTTRMQHNERSYHAVTTGAGTTEVASRAFWMCDSPHPNRKGMAITLPRVPNGLPFSCRERAAQTAKKPTISGAQRSAGTACWASRHLVGAVLMALHLII